MVFIEIHVHIFKKCLTYKRDCLVKTCKINLFISGCFLFIYYYYFFFFFFSDLSKEEITFGRGENCDVPFIGPVAKKHKCFQAYSKVHFKLVRVSSIYGAFPFTTGPRQVKWCFLSMCKMHRPWGYKLFYMLNSAEHGIFSANKYAGKCQLLLAFSYLLAEKISFLATCMFSKKKFAIVSNLRFISMKNFMLSWVEHEKNYNLGAWFRFIPCMHVQSLIRAFAFHWYILYTFYWYFSYFVTIVLWYSLEVPHCGSFSNEYP